jgi:hypothetical protein
MSTAPAARRAAARNGPARVGHIDRKEKRGQEEKGIRVPGTFLTTFLFPIGGGFECPLAPTFDEGFNNC